MREKYVTNGIDGLQDPLVEEVELGRAKPELSRVCPKAHDAKRHRCKALEIRMRINAIGKLMREADVLAKDIAKTRGAKMPRIIQSFRDRKRRPS